MMCPTGKVSLLTGLAGKKVRFLSFWATKEIMCEGFFSPTSYEVPIEC